MTHHWDAGGERHFGTRYACMMATIPGQESAP